MKISKILCLGLLTSTMILSGCNKSKGEESVDIKGEYNLTVWVGEGTEELTRSLIRKFEAENEGVTIKETIEPVSESNSATQMLQDIDAGADIYSFAQDQFARLVQGGALAKLGKSATKKVKEENDAGSVGAVTSGSDLYAYPMTSDNGYFMYYDKSVIPEAHIGDLAALVKDCEDNNKKFAFEVETSGWYLASWFFGTGCVSEWTTNSKGKFTAVNDTFNSDAGVIAAKGMQQLVKSTAHLSSSATDSLSAAIPAAILVSGTWAYGDVQSVLGDNMGVAELPSFKVGEKSYHLGSFSGNKLLGVKPSSDAKRLACCHKLAAFLTNEQSQLARFEAKSWGPSNLNAQKNEAVLANPALAALAKQSAYAKPQGQIHGSWWTISTVLGAAIKAAPKDDEQAIKAALKVYQDAVNECVVEKEAAWGLVGSMTASNWSTNIAFTKQDDGTYALDYELAVDDQFKVRDGDNWDSFKDLTLTLPEGITQPDGAGENLKCVTAGNYHFVVDGDAGTLVITAA